MHEGRALMTAFLIYRPQKEKGDETMDLEAVKKEGFFAKLFACLREDSPYSTMRVATLGVIALYTPAFIYQWTMISAKLQALQEIPDSWQWLLGILLGAKFLQKGVELLPKILGKE